MLNPQALPPGGEQYETYVPAIRKAGKCIQFDYRQINGELFSYVKRMLEECRAARDTWLSTKAVVFLTTEQGKVNYGVIARRPGEKAEQFKSRVERKAEAITAEAVSNGWNAKSDIVYVSEPTA